MSHGAACDRWHRISFVLLGLAVLSCAAAIAPEATRDASLTPPVIVTTKDTGGPGIDIGLDGTLYINAPAGSLSNLPGSPSFLFRSSYMRGAWVEAPPRLRALLPGVENLRAVVDRTDGTMYLADLGLGNSTVAVSHDKGNN